MNTSLAKHIFSLQSVPLYAIVLASLTSCGLLLMHMMGWQLWLMALLILLVWSPILAMKTRDIYRQSRWLAFFFVLLVAQSVHFTEHIAQMVQIHLLGLSGTQAHGIIGMLDLEWVHFLYNLVEETFILIAYAYQLKQLARATKISPASSASFQ